MKAGRREVARPMSRALNSDLPLRLINRPPPPQAHDVGVTPGELVIRHARAVSPDGGTSAGSLDRAHVGRRFEVECKLRYHDR